MKFVTIFEPKSEINFVGMYKKSSILAVLIPVCSLLALLVFGMPWGIDFLGGVEMQVKFEKPVPASEIRRVLASIEFDKNQVQSFGASENNEMLIRIERMAALQEKDVQNFKNLIEQNFQLKDLSALGQKRVLFDEKLGSQLSIWLDEPKDYTLNDPMERKSRLDAQKNQLLALILNKGNVELRKTSASTEAAPDFSAAILADEPQNDLVRYTVFFTGVSGEIKKALAANFGEVEIRRADFVDSQISHQLRTDGLLSVIYALLAIVIYIVIRFDIYFSPGAMVALLVDTSGALLVFVLGRVEFDAPSIAAMLTILGYSINNTIVVYDRIRETIPTNPKKPLSVDEIAPYVNKAVNDTLSRTINTTLTTLLASIALWIFTTGVIKNFSMVLTVGIALGAFSSTFVSPAMYLLARKYIKPANADGTSSTSPQGLSHEDKAKGIV